MRVLGLRFRVQGQGLSLGLETEQLLAQSHSKSGSNWVGVCGSGCLGRYQGARADNPLLGIPKRHKHKHFIDFIGISLP